MKTKNVFNLGETMKRHSIPLIFVGTLSVLCLMSCTARKKNADMKILTVTDQTIKSEFPAKPDESINFIHFDEHYKQFPERWEATFKFLIESDLKTMAPGRFDLNEDVYAVISEYEAKNPEDALFESHREYIDLQYVISGEEMIGHTNNKNLEVSSPYNEAKDITFYKNDGGKLLSASPDCYFIFFPEDIHRPSIKTDRQGMVKKIVVKIKYK